MNTTTVTARPAGRAGRANTYLHAVASPDGYIADERDDVGPLHDWYFNGDHPRWGPIAGRRRLANDTGL